MMCCETTTTTTTTSTSTTTTSTTTTTATAAEEMDDELEELDTDESTKLTELLLIGGVALLMFGVAYTLFADRLAADEEDRENNTLSVPRNNNAEVGGWQGLFTW